MAIEKIIVLEDDLIVRKNLEQQLRNRCYDVAAATTIAEAQDFLNRDNFDLIFLDVRLPDGDGTDLLKAIQQRPQKPLCVVTTGFGSVEAAVECMKNGAFDYLIKPFSAEQIGVTLKKAEDFTQLLRVNRYLNQENEESGCELLGNSPAMENLRLLIRKVARTQATVLIQGESGTGKELVARAIFRESPRANAPFIKVDVRVLATTNRHLELSVEKKEFRQDLYFRLNVVPIPVPPLRESVEDVPFLAAEFLRRYTRKHGAHVNGFSDAAKAVLKRHQWPGNVRELQNVVERAVILGGESGLLEPEHLGLTAATTISTPKPATPEAVPESATEPAPAPATTPSAGDTFHSLAELEKHHILAALEKCNGNRTHAARILDISIRTLRNKLHEYNGTTANPVPENTSAISN